ncbi:MAG: class I SAM-dependent methyltransferase [Actinobacteria bacterium]|nr:class I SAM-dependent methyltransferase [Actinomycetota bacterium]
MLDVGAGTGIATRQLLAHGASVTAVEPGRNVLARAAERTPGLRAVLADGAVLPIRDSTVDLICFAQSWHWLDAASRTPEAHRVLVDGGRWAAWWSHARADADAWFNDCWSIVERACPGTHRGQRDIDWGATVGDSSGFDLHDRIAVPWQREVSVDGWITEQASHSHIALLPEPDRLRLLDQLRAVIDEAFPDGTMSVHYETWLWIAVKA